MIEPFDLEHSGAFLAYLRRAVRNRITDEIRRGPRARPGEKIAEIRDARPSLLEELIGRERLSRYESALNKLNDDDQGLLIARLEHGLSYKEIALELHRPTADAARMALSRAIMRLAHEMTEESGDGG